MAVATITSTYIRSTNYSCQKTCKITEILCINPINTVKLIKKTSKIIISDYSPSIQSRFKQQNYIKSKDHFNLSQLSFLETAFDVGPVDAIPVLGEVFYLAIFVVNIPWMFPGIDSKDWETIVLDWVQGVWVLVDWDCSISILSQIAPSTSE